MDDFKADLIELVRGRPLLWNPRNPDYKDRDQRNQVWENLHHILPSPKGTTHKDVWESLTRCHSNALQRLTTSKKKSGSGADNSKPWKFMKQMEFLLPIKEVRISQGNLPESSDEDPGNEDTIIGSAVDEGATVSFPEEGHVPESAVGVVEKATASKQQKRKKREDKEDPALTLLEQKMERKQVQSPRMGFFQSIMPRVDNLGEDQFLEFQLQTLQLLKNLQFQQTNFAGPSSTPSPLNMSSPSPVYFRPTPQSSLPYAQPAHAEFQSPIQPGQSTSWSADYGQGDIGSGPLNYSQNDWSTH